MNFFPNNFKLHSLGAGYTTYRSQRALIREHMCIFMCLLKKQRKTTCNKTTTYLNYLSVSLYRQSLITIEKEWSINSPKSNIVNYCVALYSFSKENLIL